MLEGEDENQDNTEVLFGKNKAMRTIDQLEEEVIKYEWKREERKAHKKRKAQWWREIEYMRKEVKRIEVGENEADEEEKIGMQEDLVTVSSLHGRLKFAFIASQTSCLWPLRWVWICGPNISVGSPPHLMST